MDGYERSVPIDDVLYNVWSPQPSMGETRAAVGEGAAPWAQDMVAANRIAAEAGCVDFLSTMAANCNFRLPRDVKTQRDLAVRLGGWFQLRRGGWRDALV